MKRIVLYLLLLVGMLGQNWAQEVIGVKATGKKDRVQISFQLIDPVPDRWFQVQAYGILNSDTFQLKSITGFGIGDSVQAGSYSFFWEAGKDLGRFRGDLSFQIRAIPHFYFQAPAMDGLTFKRGKVFKFRWFGGNSIQDTFKVELFRYDKPVRVLDSKVAGISYTWEIPGNQALGDGYQIKLTGTEQSDLRNPFSPTFAIERKIPLYQIIVPAVAATAGTIAFLILRRVPLPGTPGDPDNEDTPTHNTIFKIPNN
ncbi:MAG: hypothetical protein AAF587_40055 [Bacteroidota bacterium]